MQDNQIYFNIKDNQVKVSFKNKSMDITDFLTVVSTGLLGMFRSVVNSVPEAERQAVTEDLYDMYNAAASNTLHYFAPEIDMRPHLTAQAILDAENAIIEKEYQRTKKDPNYLSPIAESSESQTEQPNLRIVK